MSWNLSICVKNFCITCQPLREAVSWNINDRTQATVLMVSLFVRLWVEIVFNSSRSLLEIRQPLREAVSWNIFIVQGIIKDLLSASSWGCELKYSIIWMKATGKGQPLREAVSWNVGKISTSKADVRQPLREAVSWNEILSPPFGAVQSQPLREAVSWNFSKNWI